LLTNAPRPNLTVIEYLKKMGLDEKKAQQVYTSGQAALDQLKTMNSKSFFHIGPPRDFDLFKTFENQKVEKLLEFLDDLDDVQNVFSNQTLGQS